ncbi:MAG TPA: VOC family protein [Caulobacteraceae bacterium]|nr:VOC family protein [Caulobacteraceae bacterium]
MSNTTVKSIPDGMHTLTPHLVCADASAAIDYYKTALGAVELGRLPGPNGKLAHAAVRIGDSTLFLVDEAPEHGTLGPKVLKGTPVFIHLYVEDADATFARAVGAGAKVVMPVSEMPWGDRYGQFRDPFGHAWSVGTHVRDVTPEQVREAMSAMAG